jgi:SAM-dependent methyltransferase
MIKYFLIIVGLFMSNHMQASNTFMHPSDLTIGDMEVPKTVVGNKSPNLNGTGYTFFTVSPVGEAFLKAECVPGKTVLDVGAGYSDIPIKALKQGVDRYVANDISLDHLKLLVKRTKEALGDGEDKMNRLALLLGKIPDDLPLSPGAYDAILADKIIHFLKPEDINGFIHKAKVCLKPGGKLYVTTASPYSHAYETIQAEYVEREEKGEMFPGHFTNIMERLNTSMIQKNYHGYKVPDEMVLFSRTILERLFKDRGFRVTESYSLRIPSDEEPTWRPCSDRESNVVGLIAVKEEGLEER